jgi:hypothetical protein
MSFPPLSVFNGPIFPSIQSFSLEEMREPLTTPKYKPKAITLGQALAKIINLPKSPEFICEICVFNSHGVGVFGREKEEYAFYWANPDETSVEKIICSDIGRFRDGIGTSYAKSKSPEVRFLADSQGYYLNGVLAERILINQ